MALYICPTKQVRVHRNVVILEFSILDFRTLNCNMLLPIGVDLKSCRQRRFDKVLIMVDVIRYDTPNSRIMSPLTQYKVAA